VIAGDEKVKTAKVLAVTSRKVEAIIEGL